jgi:hypothetical protein
MGFAYLGFPGANHTRYEHSIGAMNAAHLLFEMFKAMPRELDRQVAIRALRIAVLLHDIGHPPFSHAIEEAFKKYPHLLECGEGSHGRKLADLLGRPAKYSHEEFSRFVIETDNELKERISYSGLDVDQIKDLAVGRAKHGGLAPLNALIDGDFDADKIDYIIRDSYYCGLSHKIDLNEFRGKLVIEKTETDGEYKVFLLPAAVPAIDSLLLARYKLINEVHNNEKNRVATQLFIEKIRIWLESLDNENRAEMILDMHTKLTDFDIVTLLGTYEKGPAIKNILNGRSRPRVGGNSS